MYFFTHRVLGLLALYIGLIHAARSDLARGKASSDDFGFSDPNTAYSDNGSGDDNDLGRSPYRFRGYGEWDDEEEFSGSGDMEISRADSDRASGKATDCQNQIIRSSKRERAGEEYDYIPRCTSTGEYEAVQCNQYVCWCVNFNGQEIPDTRASVPTCSGLDRNTIYADLPWDIDNPIDEEPGRGDSQATGNKFQDDDDGIPPDEDNDNADKSDDLFKPHSEPTQRAGFLAQPLILAGIIAFAVVCLLCAVLLVMFIVYRMRKKDEGSYALDEPKRSPSHPYQRAPTKEYFA